MWNCYVCGRDASDSNIDEAVMICDDECQNVYLANVSLFHSENYKNNFEKGYYAL